MKNLFHEITSNSLNLVILIVLSLLLPYIGVQASFIGPIDDNLQALSSHFTDGGMVPNGIVNQSISNDTGKLQNLKVNYSWVENKMEGERDRMYTLVYLLAAMFAQIFFAAPVLYGYISYEYAYGRKLYKPFIERFALAFIALFLFAVPLNFAIAIHNTYVWPNTSLGIEFLKSLAYSVPLLLLSLSLLSLIALFTGSGGATILSGFGFVILSLWKIEFENLLISYTPYFWVLLIVAFFSLMFLWRWKNA